MSLNSAKKGMFATNDGQNVLFTFLLVSSLFLLWGFCNGMIDVMDKHFQEELHLTLAQSAWVQFAHYLGYFLMALPAGWLGSKLGYKGGIIAGLLMVCAGGLWFIPAVQIARFWAFLLGVCFIASGLTFLETIANPYTTVLGDPKYAATRINLAQTCNGVGWILGPIAGSLFFYSTDASGRNTGSQTLWIPYAAVAVAVLILAVIFFFTNVPDIKAEDDYHLDEARSGPVDQKSNRSFALLLLWVNVAVLGAAVGMIGSAIASIFSAEGKHAFDTFVVMFAAVVTVGSIALILKAKAVSHHGIWIHPHFSAATVTQFLYVAAQSGIFAYFINYMTSQAPVAITNQTASMLASVGFGCFLAGRFIGAMLLKKYAAHKVLGVFGAVNVGICLAVVLKLGWISTIGVFASYFFMSIMFPTIFALGIFGLGDRAKRASAYLVMAIMGGAIMPKLMGHIADHSDMSRGFLVPLVCFVVVALYGFFWPHLSGFGGMVSVANKPH